MLNPESTLVLVVLGMYLLFDFVIDELYRLVKRHFETKEDGIAKQTRLHVVRESIVCN